MKVKTREKAKKKKNKDNYYFTQEVEDSIIKYNTTNSYAERCRHYKKHIYPALDKLAENVINTNKFYNFEVCYEDTKHEVVAKLTEILPKFSPDKGKAFSFLNMSCRNYLISYNKRIYTKKMKDEDLEQVDAERDLTSEYYRDEHVTGLSDFITLWVDDTESLLHYMFDDISEVSIADSVLTLFRDRENLDFYNKKALYILIKERSGATDTNIITNVVRILKKNFYDKYSSFLKKGYYE